MISYKSMDSFNISDDNHICIRCKQTINGLENYIQHRKRMLCQPMTAQDFFNSLQLQQKHKHIDSNVNDSDDNEEDEELRSVANNSNNNSDEDESEEDIDIYRPPKGFTGGKWKPGCGPQLPRSANRDIASDLSDYSSDNSEQFVVLNKKKIRNSDESIKKSKENDSLNVRSNDSIFNHKLINSSNDSIDSNYDLDKGKAKRKVSHEIISEKITSNNEKNDSVYNENNSMDLKCNSCYFTANNNLVLLKHCLSAENHANNDMTCDLIIENELILMKKLSFICKLCSFYTNQSNNYFWHITTSQHLSKTRPHAILFQCKICNQTCDSVEKLIEHLRNKQSIHANGSGPMIVCSITVKGDNNQLIGSVTKAVDCFKCDFCGETFKFKTHLKKHTISQHVRKVAFPDLIKSNFIGEDSKFSCNKCDFKTDSEATHLLHSVNHELPINLINTASNENDSNQLISVKRNDYKYKCPLCDNSYICRELKKHINTHIKDKPFDCVQCDKKFAKMSYLKAHEKSHSGVRDQICDICGSSFVLPKLLKRHMKTHDTNRERFLSCDVCGATFFSKYILMAHMKRHLPKDERQYKCTFEGCRYAFVQKNELLEHEKVHSSNDYKPFLCDRCPYKTKSVFTFRKHYRQHTGYKPLKCDLCDYTTALSSNLCRHSRIHTGVKPYKCPYCSYTCNTQENVRKHILKTKKHSGLYVYPCKHCDHKTNIFNDYRKHIQESHSHLYTESEIDSLVSNLFQRNSTDGSVNE